MDTTNKVPTTITTEKVNPILKRDHHHQGESATASSPPSAAAQGNRSTPGEEKKHLTWDEHAIEEHDLLRGTRMKVRLLHFVVDCWEEQILFFDKWGSLLTALILFSLSHHCVIIVLC